ncbi:MAG TPA: AAA family ATPase [Kribbella sp.]|uniref:helix-turn-helix transcriptional regulator n=1 Tax=Kribbella sp. TaxID=1871183 RepID=UPI002D79446C|nr:AAA family ATPase [Kribbella sp.]HET6296145.1 AAA family ATPase [Kribbella sp.]
MTPGTTTARAEDGDFVGRAVELARLSELADKVRAGEHQTVVVQGPPGIGKSSLIRQFLGRLQDFRVFSATGDPAESLLDLGLIDQLLAQAPADLRAKTLSLRSGTPTEANPIAVGSRLLDLFGEFQRRSPIVLVIDDIQWADNSSLQALRFLLRRMWAEQLLVILVARSDNPAPTEAGPSPEPALERLIRGIPADLHLELTGLDLLDVADLARTIAGRHLPAAAARRFHSYTSGHPLLLRTMLNEIYANRFGSVDLRLAVPPSVESATRRTFGSLPEPSRALLEALAVLGGRPSLAQAADVAGVEDAHQALRPAIDTGLAIWFRSEPTNPVAITHDLQREAIYSALSPARRGQLHRRAATTVEPFLAWRHRVAAVGSTDAVLASQLEKAAVIEAGKGNHGTAATFLSWAADLTPWGPLSEKLLLTSMVHLVFSADRGRTRLLLERAARCAPSGLRSLALGLCELYLSGERGDAELHLAEAFATGSAKSPRNWIRGTAAAGLTGVSVWRGDTDKALDFAKVALAANGVPGVLRDYVVCLQAVAQSRRGGLAAGLEELRHLSDHPSDISSRDLESLACRGAARSLVGMFEEASGDLTEVVRRQEAGAQMLSGVQPHCYLAAVQYQLGEWDASILTMRRAALLADDDQPVMNEVVRHLAASLVPSARGDWKTSERLVRAAATAAHRVGGPQDSRYAAIAAALLYQARNDNRGVLRVLSAVPGLRSGGSSPGGLHEWWSTWWGPLLIDALQQSGQLKEAASELAVLRERTKGATVMASTIARLAAQQTEAEGNLQGAIDLTEECLTTLIEPRARLADGQLFHAHGRRLVTIGDLGGAAHWLTTADQCFEALSAEPYRRRLAVDLSALISRPSPPLRHHLTAKEREVADLVRQNLTNREIAARLFVTPKTIEYHLSNIFAKLGITSRRQLHQNF